MAPPRSITFDRGVGSSHDTEQVSHHIGPNIDAKSDLLMRELCTADMVEASFQISGIGPTLCLREAWKAALVSSGAAPVPFTDLRTATLILRVARVGSPLPSMTGGRDRCNR
jgi:hypothetical protein